MAFCEKCGAQISETATFCGGCGAKISVQPSPKICPSCGAQAPADMVFCDKCGARLTSARNDPAVTPDSLPTPLPIVPSENTTEHNSRESVILWCCLGLGALSYFVQAFLYRPEGRDIIRPNFLLVLLFVLQTPCFLLAFTLFFHRWFQSAGWTRKPGFRRGLLLAVTGIVSILSYFIAYQGELITYERLSTMAVGYWSYWNSFIFLTFQLLGMISVSAVLALGEGDGSFGYKKNGVIMVIISFASLLSYLYTHTTVLWFITLHFNYCWLIAPYQLAGIVVVGWKLFWELLPLLRTRSTLPKAALGAMIAAAILLITSSVGLVTIFIIKPTHGFSSPLYQNHHFYDPILLPLGLFLMILSSVLWFLGSRKAEQSV